MRERSGLWSGLVSSLHIAPSAEVPTEAVARVTAVRGRGLEGDRYFASAGTFSETPGSGRDVTLIEHETFEALRLEGILVAPGDMRRNVVTRGVALNHLVGAEFRVGNVVLRGTRLCEPCAHLARLTRSELLPALVHRGGLRADILEGGVIEVGDAVTPVEG